VVTGGATGLGRLVSTAIAAVGAHVVIGDLDAAAGSEIVDEVHRSGGTATLMPLDVCDDDRLEGLVHLASQLGPLGALVNNAGGWHASGRTYPIAYGHEWSAVLDLNLRVPMRATQLCLEPMAAAGGGAVVHISSSGGLGPDGYGSPEYGAAKAGLIRFTSAFAATAAAGRRARGVRRAPLDRSGTGRLEYERLTPAEQRESGGLIEPAVVVDEVVRLVRTDGSGGDIIAIRPGRPPYALDPAGIDPHWT
jgi:3-oxoacyl-[acyl-carrier protein] reductase